MSCTSRYSARRALSALGLRAAPTALLVLLAAAPAAATELYQWKDAKGVTHYSDSPPPEQGQAGVKNRVIQNRTGTPAQTASAAAPSENAQCTGARANLKQLQSAASVGMDSNGDGKADGVLDAQQRAAQVQLAEAQIRVNCTAAAPTAPASAPAASSSPPSSRTTPQKQADS
ncbi:DUF4124 domain-containing protein [Lysobacter capsici]|uniref:DUF4124 domain-containing protein n=1 Tax=Lysobacter capsici TaxID=435897 RepID=UPI001BFFE535|nr:DUF4124 domain-containing protein [Lysobacter sp.]QWF16120.1 DUF4124 domain-containing protein [Lysobacter capsici]